MELTDKPVRPPAEIGSSHSEMGRALCEVLLGIQRTWKLDGSEIAKILHRNRSTVSEWLGERGSVAVSSGVLSPNDAAIFEFIELFDSVSSLFSREADQISWLRKPSSDFPRGQSPLELLFEHPKNLFALREWVDGLARP